MERLKTRACVKPRPQLNRRAHAANASLASWMSVSMFLHLIVISSALTGPSFAHLSVCLSVSPTAFLVPALLLPCLHGPHPRPLAVQQGILLSPLRTCRVLVVSGAHAVPLVRIFLPRLVNT